MRKRNLFLKDKLIHLLVIFAELVSDEFVEIFPDLLKHIFERYLPPYKIMLHLKNRNNMPPVLLINMLH